jgi:outer membrane receptor for ferrienterochelin and colicin
MILSFLLAALLPVLQDPPNAPASQEEPGPRLKSRVESVSSGRSNLLDRASATVSILSGEDLRTLGVQTYTDALRLMPGLEVEKLSASESAVSVRGYVGPASASQGMLLVIDGRQEYNEFFGAPFWETVGVTLDEIKSIEVIRGPGSFLYGPNAMHGFVSITTMSPLDYAEGSYANHQVFMSMAGGTYAANQEALTFIKREGDTGLKVTIAHDDMDEFEGRGDTKNKLMGSVRFQTRPSAAHEVDLTAGATKQKFDVLFPQTDLLPPATFATRANEYYLQGKYVLNNQLTLRTSWTRFVADGQPDTVFTPFSLLLDTADVELQYSVTELRSHHVMMGAGARYSTFRTSDADVADGRHTTRVKWIFLQDEITLLSDLFLTVGARVDDHSTAGVSVAPRVALVYEFVPAKTVDINGEPILLPGQSLRATMGYGYRNPSLRELWFNMPFSPIGPVPPAFGTVTGNTDLEAEKMRSFEIGYWGRPTPALQAECSLYYNLLDHLVVFEQVPSGTVQRQNANKEDAYGVEASIEYQLSRETFLFGNYAYELRHNRETHNRIPDGPLNKANVGVRYVQERSISGMVWANVFDEITFTSKTNGQHVGHVPAYALLNGKVWYPVKVGSADGKVFLQGFNLTNHVHREHPDGEEYGLLGMAGVELAW